METIFRKVLPEEGLPTQTGRYHTNRGLTNYFHEALKYPPKGFEYSIDYWLEEIELPSEEKIKRKARRDGSLFSKSSGEIWRDGFNECGKWMRDFVLAVTPNEVQK